MAKVTGRIGLLPLKEQSALYKQLIEEYNNQIALIESLGQNDLEAQVKQLDAKVLETFELQAQDAVPDLGIHACAHRGRPAMPPVQSGEEQVFAHLVMFPGQIGPAAGFALSLQGKALRSNMFLHEYGNKLASG